MKKILYLTIALLVVASGAWAADRDITQLSEATAVTGDDLLMVVDDPGATKAHKKITITNFLGSGLDATFGAVTAASFSTGGSADPTITLQDSDNAAGTAKIYGNSSGGANAIVMSIGVEDANGENQEYIQLDGTNVDIELKKPTVVEAVNAASGSANALTLSGTIGAFNGSDTFRGIYLNYTNANHSSTSNTVALIDFAAMSGDAESNFYGIRFGNFTGTTGSASEVERAISIGTGFDHGLYSGSPAYIGDGTNGTTVGATGAVTLSGTATLTGPVVSNEVLIDCNGSADPYAYCTGANASTLTRVNAFRTIINSYGRGEAQTVTLPAAEAGMTFIALVGTQHNSAWKIQRAGSDTITWSSGGTDTTGKTYFQETNQAVGARVSCITYKSGASAWSWLCGSITGTWATD